MSRFRRAVAAVLLPAITATSIPIALAQTDEERAGARAAADAGLKAYEAKKWSDCVDFFTRAESLVHAPPHILYIARCQAQLGKLVKAREAYIKLKNENITPDKPKAFHEAKAAAEKELGSIEPRLAYINVKVAGAGAKPVTVTMDGEKVPPALIGIPRPVDPGEHKFQASAEGLVSEVSTVTVKEGQSETITLNLVAGTPPPPPPDEGSGTSPVATTTATTTATTSLPPDTKPADGSGSSNTLAFVAIGVGVVGLGLGTVFLLRGSSKNSEANRLFSEHNCGAGCPAQEPEIRALRSQRNTSNVIGFVGLGVGAAAAITGVVLLVTSGSGDKKSAVVRVQPTVGFGTFGLSGEF